MEQHVLEHEIVAQVMELLEKSGFETFVPLYSADSLEDPQVLDTALIYLKTLNARYDKKDAIAQIRCLMDRYNIQLDQLTDRRAII